MSRVYWCRDCGAVFTHEGTKEWVQFHPEVDTRQYERKTLACCPECESERYREVDDMLDDVTGWLRELGIDYDTYLEILETAVDKGVKEVKDW